MEITELLLWGAILWVAYKIAKAYFVVTMMTKIPEMLIFPIRLEYDSNQWFAWDHDNEFLGQAATKQELLDSISEDMSIPTDKFTIISEQPMLTPTKG